MNTTKNQTVSLVIIAKNEEKGLERAIESCRQFVDEVVISIDSNSDDQTEAIAKRLADRVVYHTWNKSFADARNQARAHVKTDWIIFLDGHEYVDKADNLREMLKSDVKSLVIKIVMENGMTFYFPRIVRKEVEWQNAMHNTPKTRSSKKYEEFVIVHDRIHGQTKKATQQRNVQRAEMSEEDLLPKSKENKKEYRANFYLGNISMDQGNFKKAIKYYKKCTKYSTKKAQKWLAHYYTAKCYNATKAHWRALRELYRANKTIPNRWEISKMLGMTYVFIGRNKLAVGYLVDSFKINTGKFLFNPIFRNDAETWDYIGLCFLIMKKPLEALTAWKRALKSLETDEFAKLNPERISIIKTILGVKQEKKEIDANIEVCFLVYQRPQRVPEILQRLKDQTISNFKVNIWNNSGQPLDISNFPKERIQVIESPENVGSQARFKLAAKTTGNPIIFFDDDEDLLPNFVQYHYEQYLKFGRWCILGYFTRTFNIDSYWKSAPATYGQEVDYIATKSMILDREIVDKEPLLTNIPKAFEKVEDLYLCYLARMKYRMNLVKILPASKGIVDNKDQWTGIDKEKAFLELREMGWWNLKHNYRNFGGFTFKIRKGQWDEQILAGEMNPAYYQMPAHPKVVVDIGAHIGGTSILAASLGATVYAYEPEPENYELLLKNIELNKLTDNIIPKTSAVGTPGKGLLFLNDRNSGMASLKQISNDSVETEVISIGEVFKPIEHCDLLKLDCESAEYEFIKDAPFEKIEQISMELHEGDQQEIIDYLKQYYEVETKPAIDGTSLMVFCHKNKIKKVAVENLTDLNNVMNNLKIDFCLAHGTLLGAYRDNDFTKGDEVDADITIDEKDAHRYKEIFTELQNSGFKKTGEFIYQGKFRTGAVSRNGNHIDILVIHHKDDEAYIIGPKRPCSNKEYTAFVYPDKCFRGFSALEFKGITFKIPQHVTDFFVARYGKDWETPKKWGLTDHLKTEINPSLKPNYEI